MGKSLIATAICRLMSDRGVDVVPFKAQNMANQAGVTVDGLEMPRAQILQARACRKEPHVDMGPVLMKPVSLTGAQVVVLGKAIGQLEANEYFRDTSRLARIAKDALARLHAAHECVVIEGAGSPVELNLWDRDYVNLPPVRQTDAGVVLVVDIDKGGVFAQAKGTLDLLPEADRDRLLGIVVNRFRGDLSLFAGGIPILERLCSTPVLAVVPHLEHGLDEEDRPIRIPIDAPPDPHRLRVGAILYPRVANTEDIFPLLFEPDVQVSFITDPNLIAHQHLIVLPGSKSTIGDLVQITATGVADRVIEANSKGTWLLGLCGGYQMLGESLVDPCDSQGGPRQWPGLGRLPIRTEFHVEKATKLSHLESRWPEPCHHLEGYEIHQGQTSALRDAAGEPVAKRLGAEFGWRCERAAGAYLHGLLAHDGWRSDFLNIVRSEHGFPIAPIHPITPLEQRIRHWTDHFRRSLRPGGLQRLLGAVGRPVTSNST